MSQLQLFTNTLTDTETHTNIQNVCLQKIQRLFLGFFLFFYEDIFKVLSQVLSNIADIFMITSFIQSISHQYQLQ